jgi:uncharacterized protein (DUF697 family)
MSQRDFRGRGLLHETKTRKACSWDSETRGRGLSWSPTCPREPYAPNTLKGVGLNPLPFADAALLVPLQVGMLAGISSVFGLPLTEAFLTTLVSSAVTGLGATFTGQSLVSGMLKLLPGAGTLVGGLISASVAASLTTLFGEAYVAVLARLMQQRAGGFPTADEVAQAFKEELVGRQKA